MCVKSIWTRANAAEMSDPGTFSRLSSFQSSMCTFTSMEPTRPRVSNPTIYGNIRTGRYWLEHPSGLIDVTAENAEPDQVKDSSLEPSADRLEFDVVGDRRVRLSTEKCALVVIDMQK